jgi:lipopolysaccharide export system permease protein
MPSTGLKTPMFTLLDRHILRRFLTTFFFMVLMLVLVVVTIDMAENLDEFIRKEATLRQIIFDYYLNYIPFLANLLSPLCVFLAVIFFTSKMTQDTETVAILSAGISFGRFLRPYVVGALLLAVGSFYLNAYHVPRAVVAKIEFDYKYFKDQLPYEGRNLHRKIGPDGFAYMYSFNQLENAAYMAMLEHFADGRLTTRVSSYRMEYLPATGHWLLYEARIRRFAPDGTESLEFRSRLDTAILLRPDDIYVRENYAESLDLDQLREYIALEKLRGSDFLHTLEQEWNERFAYPLASIILTFLGVALSTRKRRGGIALQLGIGFILSFVYVFLLATAQAAIGTAAPAWVGVWLPNAIFAVLTVILLRLAPK